MSGELYERDDRADSFRMIGDVIATIAENKRVYIDDTTRQRWGDTLGLLREFDTLVDDQGIPQDEALGMLADFGQFKDNYPSLGPPEVPQETHDRMVRRVGLILDYGEILRTTTNVEEFVRYRYEEVDHTAELLADCATPEVTTQPGFYTTFMPTLRRMAEAANFMDTLIDYRQDVLENKIAMQGTKEFYRAVGGSAIREMLSTVPMLADSAVMKQFWDMSVMRLRNRISHGKTPYSNVKNIS